MAVGFSADQNFEPIVGWELYQVTLDKYHVMFFFNSGYDLLNVANKFSYTSADRQTNIVFEIYGEKKLLAVDDCLRAKIVNVTVLSADELRLTFENGACLSIFDDPKLCSWWFLRQGEGYPTPPFILSDIGPDLMEEPRK